MLRFLILGLLRGGRSLHGYALVKEYRERSGLDVKTGGFYRELQRLVRDRLIRGPMSPDGGGRRTPYEITEDGTACFDQWLVSPSAGSAAFSEGEVSARALFVADAPRHVTTTMLEHMRANVWVWGKRLERERLIATAHAAGATPGSPASVLPLLLGRRIKQVAADLDLIDAINELHGRSLALSAAHASASATAHSEQSRPAATVARGGQHKRARTALRRAIRRSV